MMNKQSHLDVYAEMIVHHERLGNLRRAEQYRSMMRIVEDSLPGGERVIRIDGQPASRSAVYDYLGLLALSAF